MALPKSLALPILASPAATFGTGLTGPTMSPSISGIGSITSPASAEQPLPSGVHNWLDYLLIPDDSFRANEPARTAISMLLSPEQKFKGVSIGSLSRAYIVGNNEVIIRGLPDPMRARSKQMANWRGQPLAYQGMVTKQNAPALVYVWLLMNGLLDNLPSELNPSTVTQGYSFLDKLLIAQWAIYFQTEAQPNTIIESIISNIIDQFQQRIAKYLALPTLADSVRIKPNPQALKEFLPIELQLLIELYKYLADKCIDSRSNFATAVCGLSVRLGQGLEAIGMVTDKSETGPSSADLALGQIGPKGIIEQLGRQLLAGRELTASENKWAGQALGWLNNNWASIPQAITSMGQGTIARSSPELLFAPILGKALGLPYPQELVGPDYLYQLQMAAEPTAVNTSYLVQLGLISPPTVPASPVWQLSQVVPPLTMFGPGTAPSSPVAL